MQPRTHLIAHFCIGLQSNPVKRAVVLPNPKSKKADLFASLSRFHNWRHIVGGLSVASHRNRDASGRVIVTIPTSAASVSRPKRFVREILVLAYLSLGWVYTPVNSPNLEENHTDHPGLKLLKMPFNWARVSYDVHTEGVRGKADKVRVVVWIL